LTEASELNYKNDPVNHFGIYNLQIMEYADMGTLRDFAAYIKEKGLDKVAHLKDMINKILISVHAFNKRGILHGDIKPDNVFVKRCGPDKGEFCPIMGDWDLGYYYREAPIVDQLRYSLQYRPLEMTYYIKNSNTMVDPSDLSPVDLTP
jgi:serine/threonine protein kinase